MAVRMRSLSTNVLSEITNSNGYGAQLPHPQNPISLPRLSFSKPSWVVRTEASLTLSYVFALVGFYYLLVLFIYLFLRLPFYFIFIWLLRKRW